jgi:hypothetical protein
MKTGVMSSAMMAFAMMSGDPQERAHEPKQGKESSNAILNYGAINAPVNLQNNSQKAKRKVLLASNKKQGRN